MTLFSPRAAAICAALLFATVFSGCGDDTECPACAKDAVTCDQGLSDVPAADTNVADSNDVGRDSAGDTEPGDAVETGAADVETGRGRIAGRAYFTNHDDNSGFVVKLYHRYEEPEWQEGGVPPHATAISEKSGYYTFDRLAAGVYWLEISHGEFATDAWMRITTVLVVDGETAFVQDVSMTAVGGVTGKLKHDWLDEGLGQPLVFTEGHTKTTSEIGEDGKFRLTGLLPGNYNVCAGALNVFGTCFDQVEVRPVEYTDLGDIDLKPFSTEYRNSATISGNVTLVGTDDSSGIQVTINPETDNIVTTTDAAGDYRFENVPSGYNQIVFSAPEGSGFERDSAFANYAMYAGTSDVFPARILSRGQAIWRTSRDTMAVWNATFSPDGSRAVFVTEGIGDAYVNGYNQGLVSVDLTTRQPVELAPSVGRFLVSPDSRYAVYTYWQQGELLFSVPLTGGKSVCITTENFGVYTMSPDSKYVLFQKQDSIDAIPVAESTWASDIETGDERKLCDGGLYRVTADSKYVVCWTRGRDLAVVEMDTGATAYSSTDPAAFSMAADDRTLLACGQDGHAEVFNLDTRDSVDVPESVEYCTRTLLTPSGETVVYVSGQNYLKAFNVAAGTTVSLDSGDLYPLLATPDSTTIVYGASSAIPDHFNLLAVRVDGSAEPVALAGGLPGQATSLDDSSGTQHLRLQATGDSSAILFAPMATTTSMELKRIGLDDGVAIDFGPLCWQNCENQSAPHWIMDEDRGYVYIHRPWGGVASADILTGEAKFERAEAVIGPVAPDLSGTVIRLDPSNDLVWMSFPDLSTTSLAPEQGQYHMHSIGLTGGNCAISDDSSRIMFESDFEMSGPDIDTSTDYRVMVAALK